MYDSLQLHGVQCTRLLCPMLSPRVCLELRSIELILPSNNHFILCRPPPSSCLQSFPASGCFPVSLLNIRWPKYWDFSINLSNEYSGLISFRTDWFDLFAVQGTLKRVFEKQFESINSLVLSIFYCPARRWESRIWIPACRCSSPAAAHTPFLSGLPQGE